MPDSRLSVPLGSSTASMRVAWERTVRARRRVRQETDAKVQVSLSINLAMV